MSVFNWRVHILPHVMYPLIVLLNSPYMFCWSGKSYTYASVFWLITGVLFSAKAVEHWHSVWVIRSEKGDHKFLTSGRTPLLSTWWMVYCPRHQIVGVILKRARAPLFFFFYQLQLLIRLHLNRKHLILDFSFPHTMACLYTHILVSKYKIPLNVV